MVECRWCGEEIEEGTNISIVYDYTMKYDRYDGFPNLSGLPMDTRHPYYYHADCLYTSRKVLFSIHGEVDGIINIMDEHDYKTFNTLMDEVFNDMLDNPKIEHSDTDIAKKVMRSLFHTDIDKDQLMTYLMTNHIRERIILYMLLNAKTDKKIHQILDMIRFKEDKKNV